ncbi:MAG: hypothetical protein IPN34_12695 [Planctomycetes bacterium]|nr:hypothetical protein [Planctomycetota bacterium]
MKLSFCALLFVAGLAPALAAQSTDPYRVRVGHRHGGDFFTHSSGSSFLAQTSVDCPHGVMWSCQGNGPVLNFHHKAWASSSPALMSHETIGLCWWPGFPGYGGLAETQWYFDDVVFSYGGGNVPISVGVNLEVIDAETLGTNPYPDEFNIYIEWTDPVTGTPIYASGSSWGAVPNAKGLVNLAPTGSWWPTPQHLTTNTVYGLRVIVKTWSAPGGNTWQNSRTKIRFASTPFTISSASPTPGLRADSSKASIVDNSWNTPLPGATPTLETSSPINPNQIEDIYIGGAPAGALGLLFIGLDAIQPGIVLGPWFTLDLLAPAVLIGFAADAQGRFTLPVPVPPGTEGAVLALQAAWLLSPDPADWYGSAAMVVNVLL